MILFSRITWFLCLLLLTGCSGKDEIRPQPQPFAANLVGRWKWVKTVTPTTVITPETSGYNQEFDYSNDGKNYLAFYKNDVLQDKLYQDDSYGQTDPSKGLLIGKFGSKFIEIILEKSVDNTYSNLTTSDLVESDKQDFGSNRHYYIYIGAPRK